VWHTVGTELISRITVWIFLLFGRVARAVGAADVSALSTRLVTRNKEGRTFMAGSSHTLTRLLVDQVLSAGLARSGKDNLLLIKGIRVVGDDRSVLLVGLDDGGTSLTAGNDLGLASLRRITGTLGATGMLAVGALLGGRERGVALVAGSSNAHTDRLVDAENGVVGRSSLKFGNIDIKSVTLTKLFSTLLNQLAPRHLGNTLQAFIFSLGIRLLALSNRSLAASLLATWYIKHKIRVVQVQEAGISLDNL
jgi:hypothetical protein